jgi:hypothetical protein
MFRILCVFLVALALAGCGGDDDDGGDVSSASTSAPTSAVEQRATSAATETESDSQPTSPTGDRATAPATEQSSGATATVKADATASHGSGTSAPEGVPTPEDPSFPDVIAELTAGSSAEVDTGDDPFTNQPSRARYTIDAITDPAEPATQFYVPQPGNRWVLFEITVASIGEGGLSTPEWALGTADGQEHDWIGGTGLGQEILFMDLPAGETRSGVVVFEIPEDAVVAWLMIDPSIYVGRNIIFVAE